MTSQFRVQLSPRITPEMRDLAQAAAHYRGMSYAEFVRYAIRRQISACQRELQREGRSLLNLYPQLIKNHKARLSGGGESFLDDDESAG